MKKIMILVATILAIGLSSVSFAQTQLVQQPVPHAFKYQAVARNANGDAIANQTVSFRISIVEGSATGTTIYSETQTSTTNQFGLANLSIGNGTAVVGTFSAIRWENADYFVKIEFDSKGGDNYTLMGTSEMLSVPYAMYSEHSSTADNIVQQVSLVASNIAQPVSNPATGLIVYNTSFSGTDPYQVMPGLYYNAGTPQVPNWVLLTKHPNVSSTDRPQALGVDNTTYGGATQDGACVGSGTGANTSCPSGNYNTGYGWQAFGTGTNPSGDRNTGVGYQAMSNITSGQYNTASGFAALQSVGSSSYNVADGYEALLDNTASNNTATGAEALQVNTSGTNNVADGYFTLHANTTANGNTAVGVSAAYNTTASYNTAVGDSALVVNTSGTKNTAIGYLSGPNAANTGLTNTAAVGYDAAVTNSNMDEIGNCSVVFTGVNGAPYNATEAFAVGCSQSNGNGAYCSLGGVWTNASDQNKKENFTILNSNDVLNKICSLPITRWNYRGEPASVQHIGPMAQDFFKTFQVGNDNTSISTIDPAGVALVGIQALNKKLEEENKLLQDQITKIQAQLKEMTEVKANISK